MRRKCPQWFQDRLTRIGGRNPYGDPIFKLVWGESESMRDGGYFVKDGFVGYRDVPALSGEQAWCLMMWEPAEANGTPYQWYRDYTDEVTGLVTLGQYPYHGRYRLLKKLIHREIVNGVLVTTRMEPTHFILDVMVPLIKGWNRLSEAQRVEVLMADMEKQEQEYLNVLKDARQGNRVRPGSPLIQKRIEKMEKGMADAMWIASRTQLGMKQVGA